MRISDWSSDVCSSDLVYPYSDGTIYHVLTAPGKVTNIALQPGENLGAVASGDTVRWVIGDTASGSGDTKQTHVLVKPFTAGLATNVVKIGRAQSELQSLMRISHAGFCLKKKRLEPTHTHPTK